MGCEDEDEDEKTEDEDEEAEDEDEDEENENEENEDENKKTEEDEEQEETANICEEEQEKNGKKISTFLFQTSFISQLQRVSSRLSSIDRISSSWHLRFFESNILFSELNEMNNRFITKTYDTE